MRGLFYVFVFGACFVLYSVPVSAQELHNEDGGTYKAVVREVVSEEEREIPGTDTTHLYQTIRAEFLEGPDEGRIVTIENDYLELERGDRFYANRIVALDDSVQYGVIGFDRTIALLALAAIFVIAIVAFGGWQGVRALVALIGSFLAIFYVLMPSILGGYSPLFASIVVAGIVLAAAIFFTHGVNRESAVAYGGTMFAVILTGLFALFAVDFANLSGFAAEESVYLNFNTQGTLDFTGLLLGAIIIGVLGVLDDVAVTQTSVVRELYASVPTMSRREAYKRALRVGRDHVGALVNTLVLAYTGAALPLLLLFYLSPADPLTTINLEIFATEIARTIIGSVGLILTVPIVTGLAAHVLRGQKGHGGGHRHVH